jgi:hypothetical protein
VADFVQTLHQAFFGHELAHVVFSGGTGCGVGTGTGEQKNT